jgi:hypothetical protein
VAYVDHIKTWVPILFELRKSIIYDGILAMEWGSESEELVNLSSYEAKKRKVLRGCPVSWSNTCSI